MTTWRAYVRHVAYVNASNTWFDFLSKGLKAQGWEAPNIDTCLFTKDGIILVVYVDDAILISPSQGKIQQEIKSLQQSYDLTDDGTLEDYLGTRFIRHNDGSIKLTMPKMIGRILDIVGLDINDTRVKMHDTPADPNNILDNPEDNPGITGRLLVLYRI